MCIFIPAAAQGTSKNSEIVGSISTLESAIEIASSDTGPSTTISNSTIKWAKIKGAVAFHGMLAARKSLAIIESLDKKKTSPIRKLYAVDLITSSNVYPTLFELSYKYPYVLSFSY